MTETGDYTPPRPDIKRVRHTLMPVGQFASPLTAHADVIEVVMRGYVFGLHGNNLLVQLIDGDAVWLPTSLTCVGFAKTYPHDAWPGPNAPN